MVALLLAYSLAFDLPRARASAREEWQRQLSEMAEDRRAAMDRWIAEFYGDAATIAGFPTTARILDEAGDAHQREHARLFLTQTARAQDFGAIWIVDASGRMGAGSDAAGELDDTLRLAAARTITSGRNNCDLVRRGSGSPTVIFAVPISDGATSPVKGAVLIEVDAARNLYPLLGAQPLSTRSSETLLVRREGGSVVFLSPLRRRADPPLSLRLPLTARLAANDALLLRATFGEYVDYAGVPVFASTRALEGAGWGLVVKIDREEALAPALAGVRRRAAIAGALLVALAGVFFGVWRSQAASYQTSLARSHSRIALVLDQANEPILLLDLEGRIRDANRAAEEFYRRLRRDLTGRSLIGDLSPPEAREPSRQQQGRILRDGTAVFETVQWASDGARIPVEISGRRYAIEGEDGMLCVVRDLRKRDAAVTRIRMLNRMLRTLSRINELVVRERDRESLLRQACAIVVEEAAFRAAWIGLPDRATGRLVPAFRAGKAADGESPFRLDDGPLALGPAGTALRENRPAVVQDTETDPSFEPWREAARRGGMRAMASAPIRVGGRVEGVLSVYDSVAGVFDDKAVDLLLRLADDLGFALQSAEDRRKLQESEIRFRVLVENSLDAMTLLDAKGKILFVTRTASAILGVSAEEFLGSEALGYVHPEDRAGTVAKMREALERPGLVLSHAARCRHADGGWRDLEGTLVNRLEDPSVRALVMTYRDVTERKRAQEQLVTLSRAVEQSPVSILITDPEGRIEYVNPRFTAVSGYTLDEVRGGNPRILKSGETPREVYRQLWETITAGREWRGELHNKKKNGELYWEDALISPILDPDGRVAHFLAVKEDISRRKELEAQLLHAQKMEAVGRLAGGVAHDFNNILTVITGYTAMLIEETPPESSQREPLVEVHRMAERAAALTQQLLAFSRRQVLRPRPIALNAILADMNRMLRRILGEDIELSVVAPSDLGTVVADPGQVEQVLVNLAVNARDAMPGGGRLRIETANVVVEEGEAARRLGLEHGRYVALTVSDTGDGIPADARDKIFEPFFTTKGQGKGTGLGLATVYGIVTQSGGAIEVESEPGRGATFRIFLPRVNAPVAPAEETPASTWRGREAILLVEDEDAVRAVVRQILERAGYTIAEAANGQQALGLLESGAIADLLLTDLAMPGMDGRTLAARARSLRPDLRVLVATGYATSQVEGEPWLIHKPFNPDELLSKVREVFDASNSVTPADA
jgi:PAS domain S-box-containing protein